MNKVAVFGSLNMDILVDVEKFPALGETVVANSIDYKVGGKGVNQAAAAAAAGASTILIGTVGEDNFGQQIVAQLDRIPNLDGSRIINSTKAPTGVASILTSNGENTIAIVHGANDFTDKERAKESEGIFKEADVLLLQFEIPMDAVEQALTGANFGGTLTIVTPAPYRSFDKKILKAVSIIVPNETEFAEMAKDFNLEPGTIEERILAWQKAYPDTRLIVTRGKDGLSYVEADRVVTLEAIKVDQVDSTGAGDTFSGVLATLLSQEMPFEKAVYKAAVAAGLSVAHKGALGSAPSMKEIDLYISKNQEDAQAPVPEA